LPIDEGGAQLNPGSIAIGTPQAFPMASYSALCFEVGVARQHDLGGRALQARPASARFGAGRQLTGRQHWFLAYTCSSCLPDPGRLAVPTRPVVVGAAPTLPGASQARLPPASPACCDRPAVESLHLHSVKRNLVAHHRS
jgi:hypothetical protein